MLSGSEIDSMENILVLQHDHHVAFGEMRLWFTESQVLPTPCRPGSTLLVYDTYYSIMRPEFMTFTLSPKGGKYPVSACCPAQKEMEILWI